MAPMHLKVANLPNQRLAYSNRVYLHPSDFETLKQQSQSPVSADDPAINIAIYTGTTLTGSCWVFQASPSVGMELGELGANAIQRKCGLFTLNQALNVVEFQSNADVALAGATILVDLLKKSANNAAATLDSDELSKSFKEQFKNQIFCVSQQLAMDFNGIKLDITVESFDHAAVGLSTGPASTKGQVLPVTNITWKKSPEAKSPIVFTGNSGPARNDSLFKKEFNFEQMGIGGLGKEFQTIFRRAFASRIFPGVVKQLGINHVRGMLLFGPPGCGKTLIARQIGKILNAREPKIINGPEVLDKYVGGSEEKIRELFADAEKEQLLSKIDGVDSLNNILIIGMTNRKDMIDEAILRPGRLEMHVEIGLPDEAGRLQ
eukprot:gene8356-17215_t